MRILVVLGGGGHSAELLRLVDLLGSEHDYSYMISTIDPVSEGKIRWKGPVYRVPLLLDKHARWRRLVLAIVPSLRQLIVLLRVRPRAILSVGSNIAVPISVFGRLIDAKVIHIETGSRVHTMSATGKLMYHVAHRFFVQWESLQENYPKAIYAGRLL
jgi:UDP-N-acetylglucosamine:LPS N-acetylglucosamine transferase